LVFLSAVFTTFSPGAALPEGSVFCIHRPPATVLEIYLRAGTDPARLYGFVHHLGAYVCTDPVPYGALAGGVQLRLLRAGATTSEFWPADAALYDLNSVQVTRIAYVVPDSNQLFVVYTASGAGSVVVDENIPKSVASTHFPIRGDVAFLELDPVLRIYLRAENGKIDVRHYSVDNVAEIPRTTVRLDFSACSLTVSGFSVTVADFEGKRYIAGRFRVLDGDGRPVYIPGLTVKIGSHVISPQYSSTDKYYVFFVPYKGNEGRAVISADVAGCSRFEHEEKFSVRGAGQGAVFLLLLAVAFLAAVAFLKFRKR